MDQNYDVNLTPENENCSHGATPAKKGDTIWIPEAVTMTKYLFDNHRQAMYGIINGALRDGTLRETVGFDFTNKKLLRGNCYFKHVAYWRIDRTSFYADVNVTLVLSTPEGITRTWGGYLVLWCCFDPDFSFVFEEFTEKHPDRNHMVMLSPFLIPYFKNRDIDMLTEEIWDRYIPEALYDASYRIAPDLAKKLGLTIKYLPICTEDKIGSILFVGGGKIKVRDRNKPNAQIEEVEVEPGTIVVNANVVPLDRWAFCLYHEYFHFINHSLFFFLQKVTNSNPRSFKWKKVTVGEDYERNDPVYWMEKQANRGAYGLMMPATSTEELINATCAQIKNARHIGDLYEKAGYRLYEPLGGVPYWRIRARMVQLGHIEAKGAFNYVKKERIEAFAFDPDSLRAEESTFVIDPDVLEGLKERDSELSDLFDSQMFVYADGHVVMNKPEMLREEHGKLLLSDWASAHVDQCCLRFAREYIQVCPGRYEFGRLYYDADYHKQTMLYAGDMINEQNIDIADVPDQYKSTNSDKSLGDMVDLLRKKNKLSQEKMAEAMNMNKDTLFRMLKDPTKYNNLDFVAAICLVLKTPIWLSRELLQKAKVPLTPDGQRERAIMYILEQKFMDGIEAANEYLKKRNLEPLSF